MLIKYLQLAVLFLLPFLVYPVGITPFETPKVIVAQIIIELLVFLILFNKKSKQITKLSPLFLIPVIVIFIIGLSHVLLYPESMTWSGGLFRMQGVYLLWHLVFFSLIASLHPAEIIGKSWYFLAAIAMLFATQFIAGTITYRAVGTLGEPNALAAFAVFLWPIIVFTDNNKNLGYYIRTCSGVVALVVILYLSGSRSGVIALIIQIISLLILYLFIKKKLMFIRAFLLILIALGLALFLPFFENAGSYENRSVIWKTAYFAGWKNPIFGSGIGNIQKTLFNTAYDAGYGYKMENVDSSHNLFLDWWVQTGIVGLFSILVLTTSVLWNFLKEKNVVLLTSFSGLLAASLFNPVSVVFLTSFWWLIGRSFTKYKNPEK